MHKLLPSLQFARAKVLLKIIPGERNTKIIVIFISFKNIKVDCQPDTKNNPPDSINIFISQKCSQNFITSLKELYVLFYWLGMQMFNFFLVSCRKMSSFK